MARGQWQWVVTELPPGTSSQKSLEESEERTNPKVRPGKKSLSTEQQQTRSLILGLLDTVRDASGTEAAVRLVFEPTTSRINRDEFVHTLLAQTRMETGVSIKLVSIGTDGRPGRPDLRQGLERRLGFRAETLAGRTTF